MMTDWDVIGGNPAPGQPQEIRHLARRLDWAAAEADEATTALQDIGLDLPECGWQGQTADKFVEVFAGLSPELRKLVHAYECVGGALGTYADRLEDLQQSAAHAANRAREAEAAERTSESVRDRAASTLRSYRSQYESTDRQADRARERALDLTASGDPSSQGAWNYYYDCRRQVVQLDNQVRQTTSEVAEAEQAIESARNSLERSRREADDIGDSFRQIASVAASQIEASLPEGWANRSNLEKVLSGAVDLAGDLLDATLRYGPLGVPLLLGRELWELGGDVVDAFVEMAPALLDIVHSVRFFLDAIDGLVATFSTVLTIAAFFIPVLAPAALVVAGISLAIAGIKLLATVSALTLYEVTGTDDRRVGWGDLALDTFSVATAIVGFQGARTVAAMPAQHHRTLAAWWKTTSRPYSKALRPHWRAAESGHPLGRAGETVTRFLFAEGQRTASVANIARIGRGILKVNDDYELVKIAAPVVSKALDPVVPLRPIPTSPSVVDYLTSQLHDQHRGNGMVCTDRLAPARVEP